MNESHRTMIRRLAAGETVPHEAALVRELDDLGLGYLHKGDQVALAERLELLDTGIIAGGLSPATSRCFTDMEVFWSIGSTNTYLLDQVEEPGFHGRVCLAEQQVAGKGRRGRHWVSPFATNIAMSLGWEIPRATHGIGGLSLVMGIAVVGVLREAGLRSASLKWPNDILFEGGKLAGILIELAPQKRDRHRLVIGVGVNLLLDERHAGEIEQAFSSAAASIRIGRNQLVAELLDRIATDLLDFERHGFSRYADRWPQMDQYANQLVEIRLAGDVRRGLNRGVDDEGNLILETENGLEKFNAGEVSLRPASD